MSSPVAKHSFKVEASSTGKTGGYYKGPDFGAAAKKAARVQFAHQRPSSRSTVVKFQLVRISRNAKNRGARQAFEARLRKLASPVRVTLSGQERVFQHEVQLRRIPLLVDVPSTTRRQVGGGCVSSKCKNDKNDNVVVDEDDIDPELLDDVDAGAHAELAGLENEEHEKQLRELNAKRRNNAARTNAVHAAMFGDDRDDTHDDDLERELENLAR